jgi:adenine-specific DNA-methyltransferase
MDTKINREIIKVLRKFGDKYFIGDNVNKGKVIYDLDTYDKDLISEFIHNKTIKEHFTINIEGTIVIQTNKLVELFEADEYWQDSYTKYVKKIGLTVNGKFIDESSEVVLDFPYKDTILKASMSKEDTDEDELSPNEPFLNEVIAKEEIDVLLDKKILVNVKKYTQNGVKDIDHFNDTDNLIIKGNNLLALYTLKERYAEQIKFIYLDPPYFFNSKNKDDSFQYNSNFKLSTWLTFMKNRLEIAEELMAKNSFIAIQMNDEGVHYLKVLADSIFGQNNLMNVVSVKMSEPTGVKMKHVNQRLPKLKENILIYKKGTPLIKPISKPKESWDDEYKIFLENFTKDDYLFIREIEENKNRTQDDIEKVDKILAKVNMVNVNNVIKENGIDEANVENFLYDNAYRIIRTASMTGSSKEIADKKKKSIDKNVPAFSIVSPQNELYLIVNGYNSNTDSPRIKILFAEKYLTVNVGDFWSDIKTTGLDNEGTVEFLNGKKPEKLLLRLIEMCTSENDIVLDFFMGSATTQAVAHKMNRQYIGIEQMDYINTVSVPRLQKVIEGEQGGISKEVNWQGGGSFIYAELMEKNRGFLKSIRDAKNKNDLRKVFEFMLKEAEIDFKVDLEKVKESIQELSLDDQKRTLIKIIDKNQLYYNYSEIDDENVRDLINDNDYAFNKNFYAERGE